VVVQVLCGLIASVSVTVAGKDHTMSRRRHTPEQVIRKLAEGQKLLAGGMTVEEVCRQFGIAESTWARWLSQYGGMKADDAKRLKELEGENARLKKLLAEAELDKSMLKEIAEGNF
jgi:transposase-like protein